MLRSAQQPSYMMETGMTGGKYSHQAFRRRKDAQPSEVNAGRLGAEEAGLRETPLGTRYECRPLRLQGQPWP